MEESYKMRDRGQFPLPRTTVSIKQSTPFPFISRQFSVRLVDEKVSSVLKFVYLRFLRVTCVTLGREPACRPLNWLTDGCSSTCNHRSRPRDSCRHWAVEHPDNSDYQQNTRIPKCHRI
nr:hypothetical protein CFP56_36337 [Quercus suber]